MGHVQSKWRPKGVSLTLHGTHCVHTSMNSGANYFARDPLRSYVDEPQKNEIHRLYLDFVFTSFPFIICQ